jgi:hypothetical protein
MVPAVVAQVNTSLMAGRKVIMSARTRFWHTKCGVGEIKPGYDLRMFIEVIGRGPLPDDIDRDDIEDVLVDALGADGEVTGAGTGDSGWNLDVEVDPDAVHPLKVLKRLAAALVAQSLGWVILRPEHEVDGRTALDLVEAR